MIDAVLDSSAVLAHLFDEPGGERVQERLATSILSSVNLSEVVAKLVERGAEPGDAQAAVYELGCQILPVDAELGLRAGLMHRQTRSNGLSLGDRICLALGIREGLPVITADRAWATLGLPVIVELLR